jgi:uncharacterized protein YcbK (DUF882 family)
MPESTRTIAFHNLHTGEHVETTYWAEGNYITPALKDIDHVLRDFRTGDVARIDPRLLDLLHLLRSRLESTEPFHVISGYRSPKTNGTLAQQSSGVAKLSDLKGVAVSLKLGGVGYYPKSDFIHVDVGRVRYW